jgi:hypothetical protein
VSTTGASAPLPDAATFTSGGHGTVGGKRAVLRRVADRGLDAWLAAGGARRRIDRLAERGPKRDVLVVSISSPESQLIEPTLDALRASRHAVRIASGSTAELAGGKFQNANALLAGQAPAAWTIVVDDDIALPPHFLDGFIALAEAFEFDLAQPAQTLASHAAWASARRTAFTIARRTNFVEIGPLTMFSRRAASELLPFPDLRMGYGLDLHWGALAEQRGWRLGIVDALPVRHESRPVGGTYSAAEAVAEAQQFLVNRPYINAADAGRTLERYTKVPQ